MTAAEARRDELPVVETEVLVVGAGPTGLMAAVVLGRAGVPAVVIDHKAGPTRESRALAVQARTMEIYDQLGLSAQVIADAFDATTMQIGDAPSGRLDISTAQVGDTAFPGVRIFEQSRNERLLYGTLTEAGSDVLWEHRLVDLVDRTDDADGRISALVEGPDGLLRIVARWCIGADGASSSVRRQLDLRFEGVTDDATFWVADLRDVRGVPESSMALTFGARTFAVAFPLGPNGHTRLISLAPHDAVTQEQAMASAHDDLGLTVGTVEWFSTYRVHHRVASAFRVRSVFLAGDAAHVHSPVGGQGMNTGLQDAHNLALLLADVCHGRVTEAALDRYARERRPVALHLVHVTDRAFGVIGRRNPLIALFRKRLSAIMAVVAPRLLSTALGARLTGLLGQYRIRYAFNADGGGTPAWADNPTVGRRLPPADDNGADVRSLTWQLHTYGAGTVPRPDVPEWVEGPIAHRADPRGRLRSNRMYLIRPDEFVAAAIPLRHDGPDPAAVRAALAAHDVRAENLL
ncbi:2-polyprenyl-6-methoxyphenol hydroxylase [Mycolicibacterium madagascariense]|uniref:2-polyprenyl-6-methoxyphenol hydroxylase n=1 Tax=Mycolicibacterium madagascariense TaxID=212765 RepID=A0A7I7X7Y7_9MYCO|nr:FAD-dependent monooxygenase [Mycolicibacterium madagascariense]MCV7015047.1 FAD-dependent monooxygenase [Mycolicibacterium madagascariense]BBZ25959.1 2-polyprenyl-6-methoxyphenol hydroxylase [Mycolicibacterium madagascariense]